VTFSLYDSDHVDAKTGQPRPLQIDQAAACIDFAQGAVGLVTPKVEGTPPVERKKLFDCEQFWLWRLHGGSSFYGRRRRRAACPGVHRGCGER
jgi:mannose-6-phosphate isomerase